MKTISITCTFCHYYSAEHFCWKNGSRYVKCSNCGSIILWPTPSSGELIRAAPASFDMDEPCHPDNTGYMRAKPEFRDRYSSQLSLTLEEVGLPVVGGGRKVLDIGCASGMFLDHMRSNGWTTYGVDVTDAWKDSISEEHNIIIGDVSQVSVRDKIDGPFDLVAISDVLEHCRSPRSMIDSIRALTGAKGLLFLQGPCAGDVAYAYGEDWRQLWVPHHCNIPSYQGLEIALRKHGFHIERFVRWGSGMGDTGLVPDRHRLAWNKIAKSKNLGDTIGLLARKF